MVSESESEIEAEIEIVPPTGASASRRTHRPAELTDLLRYIGFPSGTSKRLAARTANEYRLSALLESRTQPLPLPPGRPDTRRRAALAAAP